MEMKFTIPFKNLRALMLINSILTLLAMYIFLLFIRDIISISLTADKKTDAQIIIAGQGDAKKKNLMDYSLIFRKNPFGFNAGELFSLSSKTDAAKMLADVKLVGTVSGHKEFAYAIFADKNDMQEIFKQGDSVFDLGRLQGIGKNVVIINDNGKKREIKMEDIVLIKEANLSDRQKDSASGPFSGNKFSKKVTDSSYIVDRQRLQQAIENPNQIMTDARLLPNTAADGGQGGYMLREVKDGGIYHNLGLQNGDVLLRINEYNISRPDAALQAFTALKGMERVQLDIIRSGAKVTMTYQIR